MEDVWLNIEYNDASPKASCASQDACMRISDGCSCRSMHNISVDLCHLYED